MAVRLQPKAIPYKKEIAENLNGQKMSNTLVWSSSWSDFAPRFALSSLDILCAVLLLLCQVRLWAGLEGESDPRNAALLSHLCSTRLLHLLAARPRYSFLRSAYKSYWFWVHSISLRSSTTVRINLLFAHRSHLLAVWLLGNTCIPTAAWYPTQANARACGRR